MSAGTVLDTAALRASTLDLSGKLAIQMPLRLFINIEAAQLQFKAPQVGGLGGSSPH
ncbi:MAG: hypothetical protein AAF485_08710 [Chloroflexota bacterium]